jgi:serine/threonine-protein kinase
MNTPATLPATLGRYRVDGLIGQGAMGAVYRGVDPDLGTPVALKTLALAREFSGEALAEARARFMREADTARRLQHPGIVAVHEAGEDQGLAYIAMEWVSGHDLRHHTQAGELLMPHQVAAVAARVADALSHAHRHGVVHRDIKPANVFIDLDANLVKVGDFGIARITDAARTRTGIVLGTPSFMSPEQMAGGTVDGRSDLYSLGVMMFQLLSGSLPHASESMARLMYAIVNEPAPDLRTLRPDLPEALARVVAQLLEKRPERRPADAAQLASTLRAVN